MVNDNERDGGDEERPGEPLHNGRAPARWCDSTRSGERRVRQRGRKLRRAPEPVGRQFLERGEHGVLDVHWYAITAHNNGGRLFGDHLGDDGLRAAPRVRRVADEHFVHHAAERVDIRSRVELALAHRLLGAHVCRRAETHPCLGHSAAAGLARGQRNAEVRDHRVPAVQQDVLRLDVAMDHAVLVRVLQGIGYFAGDTQRVVDGELLLAREPVAQRFAFHVWHGVKDRAAHLP